MSRCPRRKKTFLMKILAILILIRRFLGSLFWGPLMGSTLKARFQDILYGLMEGNFILLLIIFFIFIFFIYFIYFYILIFNNLDIFKL